MSLVISFGAGVILGALVYWAATRSTQDLKYRSTFGLPLEEPKVDEPDEENPVPWTADPEE